MLNRKIEEYAQNLSKDFSLTETAIGDTAKKLPALKIKWIMCRFSVEKKLERLKEQRKEMIEEYTERYGKQGTPKFLTQKTVEKEDDILLLDRQIDQQKDLYRFLDIAVTDILKSISFDVKNSISIMQMEG